MRFFISVCLCVLTAINCVLAAGPFHCLEIDTTKPGASSTKDNPEMKWVAFWKTFTTAIDTRDTATIARLSSANFYDGGGSTIQQWLQSDVYASDKTLARFKNILQKGVHPFKGFEPGPYKATGKNRSGDYFFEYKKGRWLFGGVVGD